MKFGKFIEPLLSQATARYIENYILKAGNIEISRADNHGRAKGLVVIEARGAQYSAILDSRTCEFCAALDNMQLNLTTAEGRALFDKYDPAQHPRCRCIWIYIGKESFEDDNAIADKQWEKKLRKNLPKELKGLSRAEIVERFASYNLNSRWHRWEKDLIGDVIKKRNDKLKDKAGLVKRRTIKAIEQYFLKFDKE